MATPFTLFRQCLFQNVKSPEAGDFLFAYIEIAASPLIAIYIEGGNTFGKKGLAIYDTDCTAFFSARFALCCCTYIRMKATSR